MTWETVNVVSAGINAATFGFALVWAWRNRRRLPSVSVWGMRRLDDPEPLPKPEPRRRLSIEFIGRDLYRLTLEYEAKPNHWKNERYWEGNGAWIKVRLSSFEVKPGEPIVTERNFEVFEIDEGGDYGQD